MTFGEYFKSSFDYLKFQPWESAVKDLSTFTIFESREDFKKKMNTEM